MYPGLLYVTVLLGSALAQFGFQPYPYRPYPYNFQPYQQPYQNNYYRQPVPIPYRYGPPSPQPTQPSVYQQTSNNLGTIPIGFYDNFVCNKIAGRTRKRRAAPYEAFSTQAGLIAYNQLYQFVDSKEHQQLWQEANFLARQGHHPETITKLIISQRLQQGGSKGSVNDVYNAVQNLAKAPTSLIKETQTRAGFGVCSTTNEFYCNYINKLQASAQYCSGAILSNQLYQQCCTNPFKTTPTAPVPSPFIGASPTQTPVPIGTNQQRSCGISTKNPAKRNAEFSTQMNQMRIVGGVTAERCEFPWMVRLKMGSTLCGGSIIDNYHILTAAHCVGRNTPATIGVHAGEYNYAIPNESNDQSVPAASVITHPNYRELFNGEQENDIAIIKLAQPLQFNECVQPVCLPNAGDGQKLPAGTQCTTTGWGTTSAGGQASPVLQETTIPTYNGYECNRVFSRTVPSNPNIQLCAGRPVIGGADTCQGDSGGPLFCPVNGAYVQYGVTSYGAGCASAGAAGVYTDVSQMKDFIDSVVNNQFGK